MDIQILIILFITGLVSGFYSGMVGSGGNVILIPVLDYILYELGLRDDVLVKSIIAHSLTVTLFLGFVVSFRQYKAMNFFPKETVVTSMLGMVTATITTYLISTGDWYQKSAFDIVFAIMLLLLILKLTLDKKSGLSGEREIQSNGLLIGVGGFTGIVTSLSGLGGGIILIPGFIDVMKMSLKKASSISISVISLLSIPISISYLLSSSTHQSLPWQVGHISFAVVLTVTLGVIISAPFGVKASHKLPPRLIKVIFAIVVTSLFLKMILSIVNY